MLDYKEIVVTNRHLCGGDFMVQMDQVARRQPWAVLLREKDLVPEDYRKLARQVDKICGAHHVTMIPHGQPVQGFRQVHMPCALASERIAAAYEMSVSVHSVDEARRAQAMGARFLIAGHIFATACKAGKPGRGLDFLRDVCVSVTIPVFAIGGITEKNAAACVAAGASGICRMSHWMELS
ncbi:MAG: thiamine phosphate synthase [Oscillospiraceae bacterium]|jgi:thiamine-phosphate pyrophosphorylase|nr:thiamine phosphate synthase [Oscillospiraceae bacterium]